MLAITTAFLYAAIISFTLGNNLFFCRIKGRTSTDFLVSVSKIISRPTGLGTTKGRLGCFDVALQDSFHFMFTIMDNQDKFLVGH